MFIPKIINSPLKLLLNLPPLLKKIIIPLLVLKFSMLDFHFHLSYFLLVICFDLFSFFLFVFVFLVYLLGQGFYLLDVVVSCSFFYQDLVGEAYLG